MSKQQAETINDPFWVVYGKVRLHIAKADVLIGTRRFRLMNEGAAAMGVTDLAKLVPPPGVDPDLFNLRVYTFPNLVAATTSAEGIPWPLPFEDFIHLSESLWNAWTEKVREHNPHWYGVEDGQDPKAPTASTSE